MSVRRAIGIALLLCGATAGCTDLADPATSTVLPPDATQPVNSMTQDSAMVPGGGLEPVPAPEEP